MNMLYAFLLAIIIYPVTGTFLFAVVEGRKIPFKIKILTVTFGHWFLGGMILWLVCSFFNEKMAEAALLFVVGALLGVPFSARKYFSKFRNDAGVVSIEYFSPLLIRRTFSFERAAVQDLEFRESKSLFDEPSDLVITLSDEMLKFIILDKSTKIAVDDVLAIK